MSELTPIIIDGKTRLCGLIGNPVEHTSSPAIHNSLASIYGHNLVYVPFKVEHGFIPDAVKGAFALNVLGMNVTVPYKTEVIPCLCNIDPLAKKLGAVNTLVRCEDGYKGYNTDLLGLKRALDVNDAALKGKDVVILGAGGAARACAFLCENEGASKVYILNRSVDKAQLVADEVNKYADKELIKALAISDTDKIESDSFVTLQATSVGLSPDVDNVVTQDESIYKRTSFAFDLIYRPKTTKFMKIAQEHGVKTSNGLSMLLYQGIIAYELWNDISVSQSDADFVYSILEGTVG